MKRLIKTAHRIVDESDIKPIFWIILILSVIVFCFTQIYNDILTVAKGSYDILNYLFSGRIIEFYTVRQPTVPGIYYTVEQRGLYPFIAQYLLAVWMFPVWIVEKITNKPLYNSIGSMMWIKSLLLLCYITSGYKIYKIVNKLKRNKSEALLASWFFLSSALIFLNTFAVSQIEIITVTFMLLGIEAWVLEKDKWFIVFFFFATGIKYFALLAFIPLLLVKEKKIHRIIIKTLIVSMPMLEILINRGGGGNARTMSVRFLDPVFSVGQSVFIPFICIILSVFCYCFLYSESDNTLVFKRVICCEIIIWGAFCLLVNTNPYWSVLITPFFALGVFVLNTNIRIAILFETLFSGSLAYIHIAKWYPVYDARLLLEMRVVPWIFSKILRIHFVPSTEYFAPVDLFRIMHLGDANTVIFTGLFNLALVLWLVLVIMVWRDKSENTTVFSEVKRLCLFRTLLNILIGFIPIISFIFFAFQDR